MSDRPAAPAAAPPLPELTREETLRYARHLVLPEVGEDGQRRLKDARVLCVGAGGLGSPLALYLSAAGVGTLGLVDFDEVDATNLQRQILHGTKDIGRSKLDSAVERLADVNPHVEVVPHRTRLTSANALEILEPYDVVVDGTDNFPTRYLVNDACVLLGKPNVYGSIFRWEGQVSVFAAPEGWEMRFPERERADTAAPGPCYRCLFRQPPPPGLVPNCAEGGVMGVLPGIIGSLQAMETIKWILGRGDPLVGRLQIFDALAMQWREVGLRRNPDCPVCGDEPSQDGLIDYEVFCGLAPTADGDQAGAAVVGGTPAGATPGGAAPMGASSGVTTIGAGELAERLSGDPAPFLLDVREPWEWRIGNLEDHGAVLVPLGELQERLGEVRERIEGERDVVVYCRTGARSARAARTLAEAGLPRVHNLRGGITSWAAQVDPDVEVA